MTHFSEDCELLPNAYEDDADVIFVVRLDPLVKINELGVPPVVLSNLACSGVIIISEPLTLPVHVAASAIRKLPTVEVNATVHPDSITKSSPASPLSVRVLVPELCLIKLTEALLINFI